LTGLICEAPKAPKAVLISNRAQRISLFDVLRNQLFPPGFRVFDFDDVWSHRTIQMAVMIGLILLLEAPGTQAATSLEQTNRQSHSRQMRRHLIKPVLTSPPTARLPKWVFVPSEPEAGLVTTAGYGGDINGDGYADVILGEPEFDHARGRALVFYGSREGLRSKPDVLLEGASGKRAFGVTVRMLGDLNGDGFDDVFLGGLTPEGTCDVGPIYRGSADGLEAMPGWTHFDMPTGVGDLNGDGNDDLAYLVSTPDGFLQVCVTFGSPAGPRPQPNWASQKLPAESGLGHRIACAGDVNNDGYDDLLIGAVRFSGRYRSSGKAYLYLGSSSGPSRDPDWEAEYPFPARKDVDEAYEHFFSSGLGSAGDVNRDGFDDVIVGAAFADHDDVNEGLAFVYYGSRNGLGSSHTWWAESNHAFSLFGQSTSTAGDVNGDGFSDILIGAPAAADGQMNEGAALVYHGSAKGLSPLPDWTMESDHSAEQFGTLTASAGDVNGDGYGDILILGPNFENAIQGTLTRRGRVVVVYGGFDGLPPSHDWRVDKPLLTAVQQRLDFYQDRHGSVVYWGPGLLILGAITGGFALVQARLSRRLAAAIQENRQLTLAQERTRLARDVHDNLGAQLTQISLWTDIAKSSASSSTDVSAHLERISRFAKNATQEISQLVWAMNPENDTIENFAAYLCDFVIDFLKGSGIEPEFKFPETLPAAPFSMECRAQILSVIKEALNNVIRHSGASRVAVRLNLRDQRMRLDIEDNGRGFELSGGLGSATESTRGSGLRNMRTRLTEVGGECKITSVSGQGTRIQLEVPMTCKRTPEADSAVG